jgi:hypothetical protein
MEKPILNKYRNRSSDCGNAALAMREDHKGLPSYGPSGPFNDVAFHLGHGFGDRFVQGGFGLADCPLELAQQ